MHDYEYVECDSVGGFPPTAYEIQVKQRGDYLVGIFRMNIEGWGDIVVRARVSLSQIQKILYRKYAGTISGYGFDEYAMEGFFDDIVKTASDIGKKIVRSKVFKTASKVLQHPAVLAVSQVIPGLNAVVPAAAMISKGLNMADALTRARKGSKPDMHTIKKAIHIAKKGKGKKAVKAAKLLRMADKMSWAPSIASQTKKATADIAKKTGTPPEVVKAAVEKATVVDIPKPPPVAKVKPKVKRRRRRRPDRKRPRRRVSKREKRALRARAKRYDRRMKKARAIRSRTGRWPRGFDPRRELSMLNYYFLRSQGYAPTPPPPPGQYAPALPPSYRPMYVPTPEPRPVPVPVTRPRPGEGYSEYVRQYGVPGTPPRPPWTPSYPAY
jgi:hypothetical protein